MITKQSRATTIVAFAFMCAMVAISLVASPAIAEEALEPTEPLEAIEQPEALEAVEDAEALTAPHQWTRLAGPTALTTMQAVARADWIFTSQTCHEVVIARADNYRDALSAAGYAGIVGAPILMTDPRHLSPETREEVVRLHPDMVTIIGSSKAVSKGVRDELRTLAPRTQRIYGATAVDTALEIYRHVDKAAWGDTAIIATSMTYKDALSIAPYAYAKHAPIFLANPATKLPDRYLCEGVTYEIKLGGFRRVLVIGSTNALPSTIEHQIEWTGVPSQRVAGANAIETSAACARFAISEGMGVSHMAVATTASYKDALSAVPLCGSQNSVLVLCNRFGGLDAFCEIADMGEVEHGHVLGSKYAISDRIYDRIARWE